MSVVVRRVSKRWVVLQATDNPRSIAIQFLMGDVSGGDLKNERGIPV